MDNSPSSRTRGLIQGKHVFFVVAFVVGVVENADAVLVAAVVLIMVVVVGMPQILWGRPCRRCSSGWS